MFNTDSSISTKLQEQVSRNMMEQKNCQPEKMNVCFLLSDNSQGSPLSLERRFACNRLIIQCVSRKRNLSRFPTQLGPTSTPCLTTPRAHLHIFSDILTARLDIQCVQREHKNSHFPAQVETTFSFCLAPPKIHVHPCRNLVLALHQGRNIASTCASSHLEQHPDMPPACR